jgi:GNAT superfamily N-acetyltransferase
MPKKINYHSANSSDLDTLLQLVQEFHEIENLPFDESLDRLVLQDFLNHSELIRIWLIQRQHEAIGYVALSFGYSLEFRGQCAEIDEFYIREAYRRQGIGTKTLKFLEDACLDLGVKAIHLIVAEHNVKARSIYQKIGYLQRNYQLMSKWLDSRSD